MVPGFACDSKPPSSVRSLEELRELLQHGDEAKRRAATAMNERHLGSMCRSVDAFNEIGGTAKSLARFSFFGGWWVVQGKSKGKQPVWGSLEKMSS